jgi:hypothetical protein
MKFILFVILMGGVEAAPFDTEASCEAVRKVITGAEATCAPRGLPVRGQKAALLSLNGKNYRFENGPSCLLAAQWFDTNNDFTGQTDCKEVR